MNDVSKWHFKLHGLTNFWSSIINIIDAVDCFLTEMYDLEYDSIEVSGDDAEG